MFCNMSEMSLFENDNMSMSIFEYGHIELMNNINIIILILLAVGLWRIIKTNVSMKSELHQIKGVMAEEQEIYNEILIKAKLENEILTKSCRELLGDIRRERRIITELDNLLQSTRRDLHDTEEQYRTVFRQQTPQRNDNTDSFFTVLGRINVVLNTIGGAMYVTNRFLKR